MPETQGAPKAVRDPESFRDALDAWTSQRIDGVEQHRQHEVAVQSVGRRSAAGRQPGLGLGQAFDRQDGHDITWAWGARVGVRCRFHGIHDADRASGV